MWSYGMRRQLFPACAGVIPITELQKYKRVTVPRMCGGDPTPEPVVCFVLACSPHVRG